MHSTNIRSSALSLEIRQKKYIIKHVNSVLDSKQFVKKTHALSSSTVNVVCAKVTATTTTTSSQDMWDRMNNVSTKRSINTFDQTSSLNQNDLSYQQYSSANEEEEEEGEIVEDTQDGESSQLDIMDNSSRCSDSEEEEQAQIVKNDASNLFQFNFEFGSKRPPTKPIIESEDESQESDVDQAIEQGEYQEVDCFEEDSLSEEEVEQLAMESQEEEEDNDPFNLSNDDEEEEWETNDSKYFPSATDEAFQTFENIQANIYIGSATGRSMAEESMPCECKYDSELENPSEACGDDNICINRMMFMECIVQDCPCGRLCRNRRFQLGQYARVDVIKTEKKGFGLRALTDLPQNSFIMEYIGEVIPQTEFIRRTREYDSEGYKHYYFMTLKNDEIIDATKRGCLARFMNHSCNPNCVTQKWVIGKKMRIGIFTSRAITAGEELTFDYKFERYGAIAQKCYCGELNCKGFIGGSDTADEEVLTDTNMNTLSSSNCSSDDDDDDSEDLEDELDIVKRHAVPQPLQHPHKVQSFVKRMLNSVGKPRLVNKLLMRLQMTNADNSHGREILKMIVRLHGLKMLKFWLGEWKNNEVIVLRVLQVLEKLPLANRNGLEDCKLFDVVHKFIDHENQEISRLSQYLLDEWNQLKSVYRIPKRAHVEMIPSNMVEADDEILPESNHLNEQDLYNQDMDDMIGSDDEQTTHEPEDQDTLSVISSSSFPAIGILAKKAQKVGSRSVNQTQGKRKKMKRTKYESSREFFDPDNDYLEYLTMSVTPEDIIFSMKYPPQTLIPTAPKAMLDTCTNHYVPYHQKHHYKHRKSISTTPTSTTSTPAYFSYHATNNINHTISTSTPILINQTSTTATTTTLVDDALVDVNNNTQSTEQYYGAEYYQDPNLYAQYYYAQAAAAEGMTMEEYYYAVQSQQQQPTEVASHQWQVAVTQEGATYYYNRATNQTQWEIPAELLQLQQQQPPPPPPPLPPPPSSSAESSAPTTLTAKTAGLSIEGVVDPLQLEGLVEQVIMDTEDRKRLRQQSVGEVESPTSKASSHLLTPTSGSVDATSMNGDGPYLNDIDLKQEVGKVVTKYLSSKQQSLWKGDKHLFKELARKVTHHIVDREMQSGRKIKGMDSGLRVKIEKFIDAYGTDYVSKFKQQQQKSWVTQ